MPLRRMKMGDIFSGRKKNDYFHYLSASHNRYRLLEELVAVGLHLDKDGFSRCHRYNPNIMRYDQKIECRKCINGGRSSVFYVGNAENVDTGVVKVLALTNQLSDDMNKIKAKEGCWPNDLKNGYSIDIVRIKTDNKTTYKVNKFKNESVNKTALGKMINLEKAVGITEEELQALDGYSEDVVVEEDGISGNTDDINIEAEETFEEETESIPAVSDGKLPETSDDDIIPDEVIPDEIIPDPEVPDIEKLAEEDEFGENEVPELDEDYD